MSSSSTAYIAPFGVFMLMIGLQSSVDAVFGGGTAASAASAKYWIYPLQTLVCGALVAAFWRRYRFGRIARIFFTVAVSVLIFVIWISPQAFFHAVPRNEGFDPTIFKTNALVFDAMLALRLLRAVVVVPFIEEIFWRGFLLRWVIREDFETVPFGAFSRMSFGAVTIGFMLEHQMADWPAAILAGTLFNLVAYRTKSLSSCVLAHAATNLLLSCYVLQTRQWGFW